MAKCFDSLDGFYPALAAGEIKPGTVLIFRYQGPKGAPGMPEVSPPPPLPLPTFSLPDACSRC